MTPGVLAVRERVQPPSMTRVIASLSELGLVERTPHPQDRRQVIVSPTVAGRSLVDDENNAREAWMTDQLNDLPEHQLHVLRDRRRHHQHHRQRPRIVAAGAPGVGRTIPIVVPVRSQVPRRID